MKKDAIKIYYNPDCSKSCAALHVMDQVGLPFERIEYLRDTPTVEELAAIVAKLKCSPFDLIRKAEPLFQEKFVGKKMTDQEWLSVMHENPVLIQRPIVIKGDEAVIARSEETLDDLIRILAS